MIRFRFLVRRFRKHESRFEWSDEHEASSESPRGQQLFRRLFDGFLGVVLDIVKLLICVVGFSLQRCCVLSKIYGASRRTGFRAQAGDRQPGLARVNTFPRVICCGFQLRVFFGCFVALYFSQVFITRVSWSRATSTRKMDTKTVVKLFWPEMGCQVHAFDFSPLAKINTIVRIENVVEMVWGIKVCMRQHLCGVVFAMFGSVLLPLWIGFCFCFSFGRGWWYVSCIVLIIQ